MAAHNELGKEGEEEAVRYLERLNYQILHRNWRCGRKELDIVAEHQGELVIVEVKTRRDKRFGMPEESISEAKFIKKLLECTANMSDIAVVVQMVLFNIE